MSNFIWEEKSASSNDQSGPDDDELRYDTADTRPQASTKSKHWSAEMIAHALQKSSEDQSWGVEGMEKAEKIPGGLASGKKQSSFNQKALAVGAKVEIEHTKDPKVAREIAMDHLTEDPRYYEKLAIIEKSDNDDNNNGKADAAIRALLKKNPKPDDSQVHALAGKLGMEVDDIEEKIYAMLGKKLKKSGFEELGDYLEKAHKYVKRTGTPGNYQYEYADDVGKKRAVPSRGAVKEKTKKKEQKAESVKGVQAMKDAPVGSTISGLGGAAKGRVATKKEDGTWRWKDGDKMSLEGVSKLQGEGTFSAIEKPADKKKGPGKVKKSMSGLDTLGEYLEKATPPGGKTPGGYTVKMVGGKRTYVKEKPKPTEPATETARRWGKKSPAYEKMEEKLDDLTWQYDHGKEPNDKKKAREGLEKLLVVAKEAGLPVIESTSLPRQIEATLRTRMEPEAKRRAPFGHSTLAGHEVSTIMSSGAGTSQQFASTAKRMAAEAKKRGNDEEYRKQMMRHNIAKLVSEREKHFRGKTVAESKPAKEKLLRDAEAVIGKWFPAEKTEKSMTGLATLGNYLKKALPSEETKVSPEKARKILHDGEVGGKPLTEQQRKFFGAIGGHLPAPGKKKTEKSMSDIDALAEHLQKAGPYMGPKGGKWQDAKHTIPWKEGKEKKPKKGEPTKPTELLAARDKLRSHLLTDYERSASPEARAKAESADEALRQFDRAHPEVVTAHIERHRAGLREAMRQMRQAKKTEKSMTTPALETLIDFVETDAEPLSKGMIGGYGINWADRMGGTPFEAEALQCLKALNEIENERGAIQKKYPWREIMDPVDRAKCNKKRSKEHEKIDAKSNAVHKRQNDVEKKYLDWRIEQAKEAKKSEGQDGGEVLEKSEIPTGQPTKIPTGDTSGNPEDGSLLAGQGKSSGTSNPPNPEADQDAQGHPTGAPAPKNQDWSLEEDARRVFGSGTMKSMGPIAQDRAIAESRLRKGKDDVHPYQMSAVHGDSEERTGELSKGGVNEKDPRNAIISRDVLCKGCGGPHSAMLTACPNCGDGLIGQEALAKSNPGVILENPRGAPILQRPKQEKDISVKE